MGQFYFGDNVDKWVNFKLALTKLRGKRVQALIGNQQEVYYWLSVMDLSDYIVALPTPIFPPRGAYLVISNASPIPNKEKLITKLTNILKEMKDSGQIDKIYAKYGQK